jgi:UDP-glucose 4-epimerase
LTRVLIVGASGFIGSHLSASLAKDHEVYTCSSSGAGKSSSHRLIDGGNPDFQAVLYDVRPDICVNCSGAANVSASFQVPLADLELNVVRVSQLLDAIRIVGAPTRFVHLSSAAVYGNPLVLPITENAPIAPLSPYGHHKRLAELLCGEYSQLFGVPTLSLRIFSAYGPRLRKQIFWDIFQKWKINKTVQLFGTGDESRDFIYISDLCGAITRVLAAADFDGKAINVASGTPVTIREAANALLAALGSDTEATFSGDPRQGDPSQWCADIGLLSSYGFSPAHDIRSGLKETARWLKEQA